jgi:putative toxin-antitoxin system antitoxin component (TIGR02293 family)
MGAQAKLRELPQELRLMQEASRLMGGQRVLKHQLASPLEVHDAVEAGLPGAALHHLIGSLRVLDIDTSLEKAVGLSRRTYQRSKDAPEKRLSIEHSGRTWNFAKVLALATDVLGSQEAAERWLQQPAMGLDQRRPIDLLQSPAGTELVETLLHRIDRGVYT